MAIGDTLNSNLTKSLIVTGPGGANNAPANVQVKISGEVKSVDVVQQLDNTTATAGNHETGGRTADVAPAGVGGDCYWLPWASWKAYYGQLQGAHDFFLTPNLTGCGFFVSGNPASPYVAHANCAASEVVDVPANGDFTAYNHSLDAARSEYYGGVAGRMVAGGYISGDNLQMLRPDDYAARAKDGFGHPTAVFGVKTGANWAFYYSVGKGGQGITRMLYPDFQAL